MSFNTNSNMQNKPAEIKSRFNKNQNTKIQEARKKKAELYKANNGNYPYDPFSRKFDPNLESKIKLATAPSNVFDPSRIHDYINNTKSRE